MKRKITSKYTIFLTITIILISIFTLGILGYNYIEYTKELNSISKMRSMEDLENSTHTAATILGYHITTIQNKLHGLIVPLEYSAFAEHTVDELFDILEKNSNHSSFGSLAFFSSSQLYALSNDTTLPESARSGYATLLSGSDTIYFYKDSNDSYLNIATCIYYDDKLLGALQSSYSFEKDINLLHAIFTQSTFDGFGTAFIIDQTGDSIIPSASSIMSSYENLSSSHFISGNTYEDFKDMLSSSKSGDMCFELDGIAYCGYFSPIGTENLFIYNMVPSSVINKYSNIYFDLGVSFLNTILIIFGSLTLIILMIQICNNLAYKRSQDKLELEQKRYHMITARYQGAIWEYTIGTDTLVKSNCNMGITHGMPIIYDLKSTILNQQTVHPSDIDTFLHFCHQLQSGAPEMLIELRAKDESGEYAWFELSGSTIFNQRGEPISVIGQTLNINDKKKELEVLRDNSKRDSLTKFYNRTSIEEFVNDAILLSEPSMIHAFCMIDIDNFKGINDTYGHIFGDAVIIELCTRLLKEFHGNHLLGRLGGDEFVVFLYDIPSLSFVMEKAEQISQIFEEIYIGDDISKKITGSIGISMYPEHGSSFEDLLPKADIALYHSKSIGKNCYSIYSPDTMSSIEYRPEEKKPPKEIAYHRDGESLIDSSIIANTVDILFDARDLDSSINMILTLIGHYYNLGSLTLFEKSSEDMYYKKTFDWNADTSTRFSACLELLPPEEVEHIVFYQTNPNGYFYTSDASALCSSFPSIQTTLKPLGLTCLFQGAMFQQGKHFGFLNACIYEPNRKWTQLEIDSLSLLSKIIGGDLLKLRIQESADRATKKDSLTGVYNFFPFMEKAEQVLSHVDLNLESYAFIYTDINQFKYINDTYGYGQGDHVLIEFARILLENRMENELIGRVSSDKFIILFHFIDKNSLLERLQRLNDEFNTITKTNTDCYKLSISMGINIIDDEEKVSVHIDRANIARKSITERHKTSFAFFDENMKSTILKQKEIELFMDSALENEEFLVYYQPKFNLETNKICGAEALVRWNRPGVGIIPPNDFIPIFEENGFIIDLDYYMYEKVCRNIRSLLDRGKHVVPISVNFSRIHLKNRTLIHTLTSVIQTYNIPAHLIEIEITESALVEDNGYLLTLLNEIHNLGFKLSMDDFGSGLSSLNLLRNFPFDVLKLDKDFFQHGSATKRERVVITNIVKMGTELDMEIISEGVETEEQAEFLRNIHCPIAQGYLFERPIPASEFEKKYC